MRRRPSVLLVSICIHALVLAVFATAPWWSPITNWPMPREVMAFSGSPQLARLQDIELPPAPHTRPPASAASSTVAVPELAPVVASTGIAPETEREGSIGRSSASLIETPGSGVVEGLGLGVPVAPPPPVQPRSQELPRQVGGFSGRVRSDGRIDTGRGHG